MGVLSNVVRFRFSCSSSLACFCFAFSLFAAVDGLARGFSTGAFPGWTLDFASFDSLSVSSTVSVTKPELSRVYFGCFVLALSCGLFELDQWSPNGGSLDFGFFGQRLFSAALECG